MHHSAGAAPRRAMVAPAMVSHERTPIVAKGIRNPIVPGAPDEFDVRSFLNFSPGARRLVDFEKNEIIFASGDPAKNVLFIEKGMVRLSVTSHRGKTVVLTVLDAGKFFGLWCLAGQVRRTATATAMASTTVRVIPKEQMLILLRTEPVFAEYFISFLLKRNIQIGQQVIDLLFDPSEKRLIRTLLFLSQFGAKNGDNATLSHVPQELLAEMIGSTRTHVNGFMTKLKRLGFVEYNGGRLKIRRTPLMSLL
ncbi:MAG TPA: Crp/Fnr family transcriptional regulator [Terriglobales bacterium]|nr:Crp/Fnr family transcriptional regulator [Terriglobales bacterium]